MDIVIKVISKEFLINHLDKFISILKDEKNEYWNELHFLKNLPFKFEMSVAATYNNILIGYIIASRKKEGAYIHKFMVDKYYRNKGVGKALERYFENVIAGMNISKIFLSVYSYNKDAIKFYRENGFKVVGKRKDEITEEELLIMLKVVKYESSDTSA